MPTSRPTIPETDEPRRDAGPRQVRGRSTLLPNAPAAAQSLPTSPTGGVEGTRKRVLARRSLRRRLMKPKILVPFDFSDTAERALAWAADLQQATEAPPLHLLHALSSRPPGTG